MVTAIVLMSVEHAKIRTVGATLAAIENVTEVYSVAGQYDLVAKLVVPDNEKMAEVVTEKMLVVDGIQQSETLIAFRTYAADDLEGMFSIGTE